MVIQWMALIITHVFHSSHCGIGKTRGTLLVLLGICLQRNIQDQCPDSILYSGRMVI